MPSPVRTPVPASMLLTSRMMMNNEVAEGVVSVANDSLKTGWMFDLRSGLACLWINFPTRKKTHMMTFNEFTAPVQNQAPTVNSLLTKIAQLHRQTASDSHATHSQKRISEQSVVLAGLLALVIGVLTADGVLRSRSHSLTR